MAALAQLRVWTSWAHELRKGRAPSGRIDARRAWVLTAGGYGVAATSVVVLVAILRDFTVATYTAGLVSL